MLSVSGCALLTFNLNIFALLAFFSFVIHIANNFDLVKSLKPFGGYANWITFFRMLLLLYVAINFKSMAYNTIAFLFGTFGLYFDMELDAFYVCLASIILYIENLTGSWIIWIGLLRYLFTFSVILLNIEIKSEPKQKFASLVAGSLFWCLLLPFVNTQFNFILIMASVLVVISFVKSFVFQLKRS